MKIYNVDQLRYIRKILNKVSPSLVYRGITRGGDFSKRNTNNFLQLCFKSLEDLKS